MERTKYEYVAALEYDEKTGLIVAKFLDFKDGIVFGMSIAELRKALEAELKMRLIEAIVISKTSPPKPTHYGEKQNEEDDISVAMNTVNFSEKSALIKIEVELELGVRETNMYCYPAIVTSSVDGKSVSVNVPNIPAIMTVSETEGEAITKVRQKIRSWISANHFTGREISIPTSIEGLQIPEGGKLIIIEVELIPKMKTCACANSQLKLNI